MIKIDAKTLITAPDIETFVKEFIPLYIKEVEAILNGAVVPDIDTSFECMGRRIRANIYCGKSGINMALRILADKIPTSDELKLPPSVKNLAEFPDGLVVIVGTAGSGKSTTLASIINIINHTKHVNIITIEDPIEYIYEEDKARIEQRDVKIHTPDFKEAVRGAMRQNPDVLLVGELRDLEAISSALTLAEAGNLVFCTLHAKSVPGTIDRIIDVFPAESQEQIRVQLSSVLRGIVHQRLVPDLRGGRVPLTEILMVDNVVSGMIRQRQKSNSIRDHLRSQKLSGSVHLVDNVVWLCRNNNLSLESIKSILSNDDYNLAKSILSNGKTGKLLFGGDSI